ncbi:MAG: hypothetical protein JRF63_06230 [Deltaproteobacteria bacterium]|nr:hypothetical protein [Deltaproteobacteria bacterium]
MPTSRLGRVATIASRVIVTGILLAIVIVLGQIPWGESSNEAVLRLALRTVRGKMEICTERSAEELAALPVHMRGSGKVCDSVPVTYRLRVSVAGEEVVDEFVEPGGLRKDRPHNVDHEFVVAPGVTDLVVLFTPEQPADPSGEMLEAMRELPSYELRTEVHFQADRITLVYLNDSTGELDLEGG